MKILGRSIFSYYRSCTSYVRLLPDFLIIGAQKAGTSSLFYLLEKHPLICPAYKKEIHFFDKLEHFRKGKGWYQSYFPTVLREWWMNNIRKRPCITGEATPYYLFHPHVPRRVASVLPQVKIIILLRNPIDRAYSHYSFSKRSQKENLSFKEAIFAEEKRMQMENKKVQKDENYWGVGHRFHSYLSRGIYVDQLRRWFDFFERKQFLVLKSEDFFKDPKANYKKVLEFLKVPFYELEHYPAFNRAKYPPMLPILRSKLSEHFHPHNQALEEFLGMELGWD